MLRQRDQRDHALLGRLSIADQPLIGQRVAVREKKDLLRLFHQSLERFRQLIGLRLIESNNQQWLLERSGQCRDNEGARRLRNPG